MSSAEWNATGHPPITSPPMTSTMPLAMLSSMGLDSIVANLTATSAVGNESTTNATDVAGLSAEAKLTAPAFELHQWRYSTPWTVILSLAYLVVFLLGLVGNASVLWVVFGLRRTSSHSMFANCNKVFNGLIANLALADLLVIICCLPATLVGNILTPWILGRFVCKAVPYLQGVSVTASVYTLVAISIDRFYGIYYPFANGFSTLVRRLLIVFIWAFSLTVASPWAFVFDLVPYEDYLLCMEVWPSDNLANAYFLGVNLGLQYLLPLSIIIFFYILLFVKIWRRKFPMFHTACQRETSTDTVDRWNARHVEASKLRVLKMLIIIVSLFALSWLPLYGVFIRVKFGGSIDDNSFEGSLVFILTPLAQWLGASNSCVNPILYFFFNAKFRAYLKKAITRSILCSSSVEYSRNHLYYYNHNQTVTGGAQGTNAGGGGGGGAAKDHSTLLDFNHNHHHNNNNNHNHNRQPLAKLSNCKGKEIEVTAASVLTNGTVPLNVLPIVVQPFVAGKRAATPSPVVDDTTLSTSTSPPPPTPTPTPRVRNTSGGSRICRRCHSTRSSVGKRKSQAPPAAPPPSEDVDENNTTVVPMVEANQELCVELVMPPPEEEGEPPPFSSSDPPHPPTLGKWSNSALDMITTAAVNSGRHSRETSV